MILLITVIRPCIINPGDLHLRIIANIATAHDAAIQCMVYGKDADNSWIITGSFDHVVKLWSLDGKCLQRFDGFRYYAYKLIIQ
jgi:WD40 repeat protein